MSIGRSESYHASDSNIQVFIKIVSPSDEAANELNRQIRDDAPNVNRETNDQINKSITHTNTLKRRHNEFWSIMNDYHGPGWALGSARF